MDSKAAKSHSLLKAAWIIALVAVASKLMGFLRDVVVAKYYGAGLTSDAYFYAYQIPSLALVILGGVGGPFHSAAVSVFSKILPAKGEKPSETVNKLYSTFLTTSFFAFLILAVLTFMFSDVIMQLIISNNNPELITLAGEHLKIMSPILVLGGVIGIYYGLLVSRDEFLIPNISPMIMSIAIISIVAASKHDNLGVMLALATTVGAFCQFLFQVPKIRQLGFRFKPNLDIFNNPQYKNICELLFPAILSSTVGQFYIYVDMFFASSLEQGAWTAFGYANRVFQFPVGILVTAFLVPLFPLFAKLVAEVKHDDIRYYFDKGVGLLNFVSVPIFISIALIGFDGVQLIFQRGAFDARATILVGEALFYLSIGLIPYVFRDSITRVFYSFNDSTTPFLVALVSIFTKVLLNFILITKLHCGIGGLALSTSFVTLINAVLLGSLIHKKIKMDYSSYFKNLFKMFLAGAAAYVCAFGIYKLWAVSGYLPLFIKTSVMILLCFTLYVLFAAALKIKYVFELYERLKSKIR